MKNYKLETFSSPSAPNFSESLNPEQLKVVTLADGPCLVLAGAGSGKTRVLIYRLAYLLNQGIPAQNILLVTFTNKAAQEMLHRAESLIKSDLSGLWAGTFHHIGNIILRKETNLIGYDSNFTIIDREDAKSLMQDCLEELGFTKSDKLFPKKELLLTISSLAQNTLLDIDQVLVNFYPHIAEYGPQIRKSLSRYSRKKKEAQIMDFDDLLTYWLQILQQPQIREKYAQTFRYILVDEYQDTNRLQFEIIKLLASAHKNILAVGDDAQSIYSFRGAEINNVLDFPQTFPGTKTFKLELNYRSTPKILNLANQIIKHNLRQFPKTLTTTKTGGDYPAIIKAYDIYQQAKFIGQRVLELNQEGLNLNEIAVLFRSRYQAMELEVELIKRNIPYILRGGVRFFEQAHIKDVLSYLKIINNNQDELSFKRALALQKGIGRSYAYRIWEKLKNLEAVAVIEKSLPKRQQESFKRFNKILDELKKIEHPEKALQILIQHYKDYCYLSFDNPDDRIADLEELAKLAHNYISLRSFLADLGSIEEFKGETRLEASSEDEILVLSTIHQAKGLEWDIVFLIGFSDYEFPAQKSLSSTERLEEERRLFYVAATRAKQQLYISYPETKYTQRNGVIISRPSSFYYELPADVYEEWNIQG